MQFDRNANGLARAALEQAGYGPRVFDVRVREVRHEGNETRIMGTFSEEISGPKHSYEVVYDRYHSVVKTKID